MSPSDHCFAPACRCSLPWPRLGRQYATDTSALASRPRSKPSATARALAGLSERPGIPRVALRMIMVGEETGKLDEMLLRTAFVLEQQSQRRIERLMTLLTPALTIAIAGLVGGLMLTVMNAILSVNELALQ